jgi:hypothetical protein
MACCHVRGEGSRTYLVIAVLHTCDLDLGRDEGLCNAGGCQYICTKEVAQKAIAKFVAGRVLVERKRQLRDELHETV